MKTVSNVQRLMKAFSEIFDDMEKYCQDCETFSKRIQEMSKTLNELPLARERFALNEFISFKSDEYMTRNIALVYMFKGNKYSTNLKPIPGMESTEVLHSLSAEKHINSVIWDAMGKECVYVSTGKVYQHVKPEDTSITSQY